MGACQVSFLHRTSLITYLSSCRLQSRFASDLPRHFYDRYDADRLLDSLGLTPEAIASTIVAAL